MMIALDCYSLKIRKIVQRAVHCLKFVINAS